MSEGERNSLLFNRVGDMAPRRGSRALPLGDGEKVVLVLDLLGIMTGDAGNLLSGEFDAGRRRRIVKFHGAGWPVERRLVELALLDGLTALVIAWPLPNRESLLCDTGTLLLGGLAP